MSLFRFLFKKKKAAKPKPAPRRRRHATKGDHHDLIAIYTTLNQSYFKGKLDLEITWFGSAERKARRHRKASIVSRQSSSRSTASSTSPISPITLSPMSYIMRCSIVFVRPLRQRGAGIRSTTPISKGGSRNSSTTMSPSAGKNKIKHYFLNRGEVIYGRT
jgi:hypothetical protein